MNARKTPKLTKRPGAIKELTELLSNAGSVSMGAISTPPMGGIPHIGGMYYPAVDMNKQMKAMVLSINLSSTALAMTGENDKDLALLLFGLGLIEFIEDEESKSS